MSNDIDTGGARGANRWRLVIWGGAAALLAAPAIAMRFTDEVRWSGIDFAIFGTLLAVVCGLYELAVRMTANTAYRAAVAVAVVTAFLLVWVNLAVGFIGDEGNPANLMFGGVLAIAVAGAVIARFQPGGMARALVATAAAQALVAAITLATGQETPLIPTAVFVALWLGSAWLFGKAARDLRAAWNG